MFNNLYDPVIIIFVMGIVARLLNVSLNIHSTVYDTVSIFLLLALGIKGGYELNRLQDFSFLTACLGALSVGVIVPSLAFFVAYKIYKLTREDAVALAAHYGAGSAVTFAVVMNFLEDNEIQRENFYTILLVLMDMTGILIAFCYLHLNPTNWKSSLKKILHDVILNKSIYLMLTGILVGYLSSDKDFAQIRILFFDLFKGILCFFMLEMGLVCGQQIPKIMENGRFIALFGIIMPLLASAIGLCVGRLFGLSIEGTTILATIGASASYIAAPAVTRAILPNANLSVPLTCSLGITFPFNVIVGVPLYFTLAKQLYTIFP